MISITRERLLTIQQWRETYGPGSNVVLPAEEAEKLACIALERMDAKAVAWTDADELRDVKNGGSGYLFAIGGEANKFADPRRQVILYTAPPAPIVPKELRELLGTLFNTDGRRGADFDLFDYLKARDDIVSLLQRNE
ncbi:hypothetical protein [Enterobacter cloacae]|uniref:hypothetical protein n=1 Tax=Enterobacter cloacae TaxID=550 RepID=UPI0019D6DDEF|nr:hypothetical protein [Enterobacter cloacae]MCK7380258.1 hypothetical protein [Enterobacter cloacae]